MVRIASMARLEAGRDSRTTRREGGTERPKVVGAAAHKHRHRLGLAGEGRVDEGELVVEEMRVLD
jgi:hypothetical protein